MDPSTDVGIVLELYTTRSGMIRFDLGDTTVRYGDREVTSELQPPRPVGGFLTHNRQWSLGVSVRF